MERKIGEIFDTKYCKAKVEVIMEFDPYNPCAGCVFLKDGFCEFEAIQKAGDEFNCFGSSREDGQNIIFKEVTK